MQFPSNSGLHPDCFIRLFEYVNPGKDCINIKFYDTSEFLSEEKYKNFEKVKSGPKPKLSAKEQLFTYLCGLKNRFTFPHISLLF